MMATNVFAVPAVLAAATFGATTLAVPATVDFHDNDGAVASGANHSTTASESRSWVIKKTVVSSRFRLVFAIGLEGSGHHYFIPALEQVFHDNKGLVRVKAGEVLSPNYFPDAYTRRPSVYSDAVNQGIRAMKDVAAQADKLGEPGTFASAHQPQHSKTGCGKLYSYPCKAGSDKMLQFIDATMLAQAAEAAGVDLRVVYLQRSAKDLMLADASHRHMQK